MECYYCGKTTPDDEVVIVTAKPMCRECWDRYQEASSCPQEFSETRSDPKAPVDAKGLWVVVAVGLGLAACVGAGQFPYLLLIPLAFLLGYLGMSRKRR